MSARAWQRRRCKGGLVGRRYVDIVERKLRRQKGQPLPISATTRGPGFTLTMELSAPGSHDDLEEDW